MKTFLEKHAKKITGVLSCFDRMRLRGYLPILSGMAMAQFLNQENIKFRNLKDFLTEHAVALQHYAKAMADTFERSYAYFASLVLVNCVFFCLMAAFFSYATAAELPETIAKVKPSIVGVGTFQKTRTPAANFLATGFVIADGRHVVTNAHALPTMVRASNKEFLAVFLPYGFEQQRIRTATVVDKDDQHDLAILKISDASLPALRLGHSENIREGESLAFTGFPIGAVLGLRPVTHRGIVSAITPIVIPAASTRRLNPKLIRRLTSPYDVFQLDATAYPGNSGSPLYLPDTGEVVGVINSVFVKETKETVIQKPSGISYAIPAQYVKVLLEKAGIAID